MAEVQIFIGGVGLADGMAYCLPADADNGVETWVTGKRGSGTVQFALRSRPSVLLSGSSKFRSIKPTTAGYGAAEWIVTKRDATGAMVKVTEVTETGVYMLQLAGTDLFLTFSKVTWEPYVTKESLTRTDAAVGNPWDKQWNPPDAAVKTMFSTTAGSYPGGSKTLAMLVPEAEAAKSELTIRVTRPTPPSAAKRTVNAVVGVSSALNAVRRLGGIPTLRSAPSIVVRAVRATDDGAGVRVSVTYICDDVVEVDGIGALAVFSGPARWATGWQKDVICDGKPHDAEIVATFANYVKKTTDQRCRNGERALVKGSLTGPYLLWDDTVGGGGMKTAEDREMDCGLIVLGT